MARVSLDALRRYCATLPGATRDVKWGADEVYSVGAKMFAVFGIDGGHARGLSFKVDEDRFLELTDRDGIVPAPYLARAHWVKLEPAASLTERAARELVARSHALVLAKLPRKVRDAMVAPASSPARKRAGSASTPGAVAKRPAAKRSSPSR